MKTNSQDKRYRDGYAAGIRDGGVPSDEEAESQMRSLTGDSWADDGYSQGFYEGREQLRKQAFAEAGQALRGVFSFPGISAWLRRMAGSHQGIK